MVPGSSNPKHIQENIEVFDFELTPEEMARMEALDQEKRYFTMSYDQIKAWMGDYQIWDEAVKSLPLPLQPSLPSRRGLVDNQNQRL